MPAPLVWINGFPGVGKLTVAKEITLLHEASVLVSNHSLIDPVARRLGPNSREHPRYQEERRAERQEALRKWVTNSMLSTHMIIFTDFQSTDALGSSVAQEYKIAADEAGRPFIPIYLTCEAQTNIERATSQERKESGTTKLTDATVLSSIVSSEEIYRFQTGRSIDTTKVPAQEVAAAILAYCEEQTHLQGQD
ncbi:AAA domain-containing protein [Sarocladium implicatum]|nr:AAA domain-containing protein [Sarocladium implicatum]